ncbi:RHS repeat domain-containing protein [Tardiphaga sp. 619_E2_N8_5]|uniref:RHS repeat domain-containing protein n=1 Tax=unclassified Tardiphaga TaxID=2631404 RepID=UPI003F25DF7C
MIQNSSAHTLQSQHASYTSSGNISSIDHALDGVQNFSYDNFGRLTNSSWSKFPSVTQSHSYDSLDRLASSSQSGPYQYNASVSDNGPSAVGGQALTYDTDGNIAKNPKYTLRHDPLGRLIGVDGQSVKKTFSVNANGRRVVQRVAGSSATYFPFSDVRCRLGVCELDLSVSGTTRILRRQNSSLYFHKDISGNPSLILDSNGYVADKVFFTSFGEVISHTNFPTPLIADGLYFQFKRALLEPSEQIGGSNRFLQLLDFDARAYDPNLALFVEPDVAIGERSDSKFSNRYAYAAHNPNFYLDATGAMTEEKLSRWKGFAISTLTVLAAGSVLAEGAILAPGVNNALIGIAFVGMVNATADLKAALSDNPADMVIADAVKALSDPTTAATVGFAMVVAFAVTGDAERSVKAGSGIKALADLRELLKSPNAIKEIASTANLSIKEAKEFVELANKALAVEGQVKDVQGLMDTVKSIKEQNDKKSSDGGGVRERPNAGEGATSSRSSGKTGGKGGTDSGKYDRAERRGRTG